jgi:GH18 family chitinase
MQSIETRLARHLNINPADIKNLKEAQTPEVLGDMFLMTYDYKGTKMITNGTSGLNKPLQMFRTELKTAFEM